MTELFKREEVQKALAQTEPEEAKTEETAQPTSGEVPPKTGEPSQPEDSKQEENSKFKFDEQDVNSEEPSKD